MFSVAEGVIYRQSGIYFLNTDLRLLAEKGIGKGWKKAAYLIGST